METPISKQLSLPVQLNDFATLDNYYMSAGSANADVLSVLKNYQKHPAIYLWGERGSGVSHLLQAVCHQASTQGASSIYLPMKEFSSSAAPEELLSDIEKTELVCIDDLDAVAAQSSWSEHMFHMFNRCIAADSVVIFGAQSSPAALEVHLPDLESRLRACLTYKLRKLNDSEKVDALVFRAKRRGMDMPAKVADYLVTRFSRDLADQFDILEKLDRLSLVEKRTLTIPFVKNVMEQLRDE